MHELLPKFCLKIVRICFSHVFRLVWLHITINITCTFNFTSQWLFLVCWCIWELSMLKFYYNIYKLRRFMDFNTHGFLGADFRGVRTPSSNHGLSLRHPRERDVLAAEGTFMLPSRCWPEEGWVYSAIARTMCAFNTKCGKDTTWIIG